MTAKYTPLGDMAQLADPADITGGRITGADRIGCLLVGLVFGVLFAWGGGL